MWDRYYINYPSGYGQTNVLCHHVIDVNGNEWWIFNRGEGEGPNGGQAYNFSHYEDGDLVPDQGSALCPTLFDRDIQIPWAHHPYISLNIGSASFTSDVDCISDLINVMGYPGDENSVYNMIDDLNLGEGHVIIKDTEDEAESLAMTIAFGLEITPFKSLVVTSDHTISMISPIKKKKLWSWSRVTNDGDSTYKDDGLYGGADLAKYAAFSVVAPNITGSSVKPAVGNCMTFGVDAHSTVPYTLGNYTNGGGGGGSDLPDVDISDEGKVLTVNSSGNWEDLYPEPFKLAGNIDSQTAIDVENYLSVRGGIRGDKVGGVASIYADPSAMHIGNYVDISSAKTGGFSATKTEDANTGVTTLTLDIDDIDKFMQIEAAAGSGINVTKSLDSQTHVRTYTLSNSSEISLPNYLNDFDSTMLSSWLSAFPIASDGAYHAINPGDSITLIKFSAGNTNETHQIDISVEFDVDANTPAGSYATVVLSTSQHSGTPIAVGTSISRVVGSAVDSRMLIPGVKNTFKLSLAVVFTTDTRVYINVLQNSGSSIVGTNNPYCSYKATRIGMSS